MYGGEDTVLWRIISLLDIIIKDIIIIIKDLHAYHYNLWRHLHSSIKYCSSLAILDRKTGHAAIHAEDEEIRFLRCITSHKEYAIVNKTSHVPSKDGFS